jgi:AhpD family alkylhydroperoxidase
MQMSQMFPAHTIETAPQAAQRTMRAVEKQFGFVPGAVARLAESPQLLDGFLRVVGMFEASTLDRTSQEVLVMTMAVRNGCHLCVAMHTGKLRGLEADEELIAALQAGEPLADARLEGLRTFVLEVLATTGDVSDEAMRSFLGHGYTLRNALEVVLGIGTYTMSTFANRLTSAPLDEPFARLLEPLTEAR